MAQRKMTVTLEVFTSGTAAEPERIVVGQREFIKFERRYQLPAMKTVLQDAPYLEHFAFLAWCALRHQGREGIPDDFDVWIEDGIEVMPTKDDDEEDVEGKGSEAPPG
jgi:hypothetical protein